VGASFNRGDHRYTDIGNIFDKNPAREQSPGIWPRLSGGPFLLSQAGWRVMDTRRGIGDRALDRGELDAWELPDEVSSIVARMGDRAPS
jgi:hypothetical protein